MDERRHRLDAIKDAIGARKLVWFGTRGSDAAPLCAIPQFTECYSITARLQRAKFDDHNVVALDEWTGTRVDLDTYDIDTDTAYRDELRRLRRRLLSSLREPNVLVAYRPSGFLSSLWFANFESVEYAGIFHERQAPFEHKPWVESSLRRAGVSTVPWHYVADEDHLTARSTTPTWPVLLRASHTSGGVGIVRVDENEADRLQAHWPNQPEAFVGVAPYLRDTVPLNVGACVFPSGRIAKHPPSVQLIGVPELTSRPFGYCGNDFGAIKAIDEGLVAELDRMVDTTGRWLFEQGYIGAFGLDALVHEGHVLFTEINPRFQGSSDLAADIARRLEAPDLYLDHLAAYMLDADEEPRVQRTLVDWVREQPDVSQLVMHNTGDTLLRVGVDQSGDGPTDDLDAEMTLFPALFDDVLEYAPGAMWCRPVVNHSVTGSGFDLRGPVAEAARVLTRTCFGDQEGGGRSCS